MKKNLNKIISYFVLVEIITRLLLICMTNTYKAKRINNDKYKNAIWPWISSHSWFIIGTNDSIFNTYKKF